MSMFGRKPTGAPTPSTGSGKNPSTPTRTHRHTGPAVPHSRQTEHATDAPRGIDSNFCYGDEQES
jgi:hypothetical protein